MKYTFSNHSKKRIRQRGVTNDVLFVLDYFGDYVPVVGSAVRIHITNKKKSDIISNIKKMICEVKKV
jgi:hypothetical protein